MMYIYGIRYKYSERSGSAHTDALPAPLKKQMLCLLCIMPSAIKIIEGYGVRGMSAESLKMSHAWQRMCDMFAFGICCPKVAAGGLFFVLNCTSDDNQL